MKTMMIRAAMLAAGFVAAGSAFARSDIRDGNAMVKPVSGDKYSIDGSTMGKAELYGYMGGLRDDEHITGIVLKRGGTDEQRKIIGVIAKTLGLKSFEQDGGDLKEIPQPETKPAPPPIEQPAATEQPAAAAPAAPAEQPAATDKPAGN
ncbi:hypothetical protein [Dokdonella sp.]|uniref:hypothetical protein n=1 Tax=Dokdonella sp. TaxID=2291710 RepID=UPI003784B9DF